MKNKNRDVKFIIYQSLYIFVVCVVALKGANLDLVNVIADDGKPKVIMTPEKMDSINNLLKHAIIVDTTNFVVVPKSLLEEDKRLKEIVKNMPPIVDMSQYVHKSEVPEVKIEDKPEVKQEKEIVIGSVELWQYHQNIVPNQGDNAITLAGVTIPPHSTGKVTLGGESSIVISAGNVTRTVSVKENRKPQISFQRMIAMGEDARVTDLQRNVCYRVTINDDFPDQLDVKFSGGVTVKQVGAGIYDVTMAGFSSRSAYDNFTDNRESPYQVGFTVTVKDRLAPHSVAGQNVFIFGEY